VKTFLNDTEKNTYNWTHSDSNNVNHLVSVRDIWNLNVDDIFLVLGRDNKKKMVIPYILILKIKLLGLTIIIFFFIELEKEFSSY
jgi:acetyl-CoA carboxylase carboxyl transferase subunit beta